MIGRRHAVLGGVGLLLLGCAGEPEAPRWRTVEARLQGLAAAVDPAGGWRVTVTDLADPYAAATPDDRIEVTRGLILAAEDEAEMAGALANAIVLAEVAAGGPVTVEFTDIVSSALGLPGQRADMVARLKRFPGGETGEPLRAAMTVAADAGYDPGGLVRLEKRRPLRSRETEFARKERLAVLERQLPKVRREYPGADQRNIEVWARIRRSVAG